MNTDEINQIIDKHASDNLSPKQKQRDYISVKYQELCGFLKGNCFQSGSYARFTAINPVHDLDVIYTVSDIAIQQNPSKLIDSIATELQVGYSKSLISRIKRIYHQTHSVTIEFADSPEDFSIDIVPAIILSNELNEYNQPLYLIPEIIRLNKHNRTHRYAIESEKPIIWVKSDPRGYIQATSELNSVNNDFRHTAKIIKTWRHNCKMQYQDQFCLKSFHLELIVYDYFVKNSGGITLDAIIYSLGEIPTCLSNPHFPDRADSSRKIDDYVTGLTPEQKQLIVTLQSKAYTIARLLPSSKNEKELTDRIVDMLSIGKQANFNFVPAIRTVTPPQPWSY